MKGVLHERLKVSQRKYLGVNFCAYIFVSMRIYLVERCLCLLKTSLTQNFYLYSIKIENLFLLAILYMSFMYNICSHI